MNEQRFAAPQRWVLGLTAAASFIAVMDGMVVTTALDSIRRDLTAPAVQSAVLGSVAPRDMGKASGIYNTMRQLGWACGAAAAIAVFSGSGSLATAQTLRNGYAAVLLLTAALSIAGALLSLKLPSAVRANVRPAAAPAVSSPE
jgi:hypothetical protein